MCFLAWYGASSGEAPYFSLDLQGLHMKRRIGIRLHGSVGDTVHASTAFWDLIGAFGDAEYFTASTCTVSYRTVKSMLEGVRYISDHLKHLTVRGDSPRASPLLAPEWKWFHDHGCELVYDLFPFDPAVYSGEIFARTPLTIPRQPFPCLSVRRAIAEVVPKYFLEEPDRPTVALYRYSGWHPHFPERNLDQSRWDSIVSLLLEKGFRILLLGLDDPYGVPKDDLIVNLIGKLTINQSLAVSRLADMFVGPISGLFHYARFYTRCFAVGSVAMQNEMHSVWFTGALRSTLRNVEFLDPMGDVVGRLKALLPMFSFERQKFSRSRKKGQRRKKGNLRRIRHGN